MCVKILEGELSLAYLLATVHWVDVLDLGMAPLPSLTLGCELAARFGGPAVLEVLG